MTEARLDRIEAILQAIAGQQQTNTTAIAQLTSRFDGLVIETQRVLTQLAERQTRTEATVESLASAVAHLTQNAETNLASWRENQAEIRRIWEYLLGQQRNGNGNREGGDQ